MPKIIDYKIIQNGSKDHLVEQIKLSLNEGFQPYGFTEIKGEAQYLDFYQVMVKYEEIK